MLAGELLRLLQAVPDLHQILPCLDGPYSKQLHSNYAAPDWEFPIIREIISKQKAQLDDIDSIIGRVETVLNQFREKREQIASSIKAHEGFVTRIRRLPSEILGEVFVQCLPHRGPVNPDAKAAPLLLTGICKRWREVALNTPRLWSSLAVKQQLARCHDWLKNAKDCPLSLGVNVHSHPGAPNSGRRKAALEFLQQYTNRLISLTVGVDEPSILELLFGDIPRLERLCLAGNMEMLRGHRLSVTQPQPRLHTLIIYSSVLNMENLSLFDPGWTNLTRLAMVQEAVQYNAPNPIFLLLQMCPNLEHFIFSPLQHTQAYNSKLPSFTLTHSKLRSLKITEDTVGGWGGFRGRTRLILPNLCYLDIRNDFDYYIHIHSEDVFIPELPLQEGKGHRILNIKFADIDRALLEILNPSWTALTHIRADLNGCEDILISFYVLHLCPNLEHLVISSMHFDDNNGSYYTTPFSITHPVLRSLSIEITGGVYPRLLDLFMAFPSLRHFDLSLPANSDWPHTSFKALLSRSNCPLETLKIVGPRISTEEREEIASLIPTLRHVELIDGTDTEVRLADVPVDSSQDSDDTGSAGSSVWPLASPSLNSL